MAQSLAFPSKMFVKLQRCMAKDFLSWPQAARGSKVKSDDAEERDQNLFKAVF